MNEDEKKITKVLYFIGIIPVIWLALLLAPYTKGGLIEIIKNGSVALENPFKTMFINYGMICFTAFYIIMMIRQTLG